VADEVTVLRRGSVAWTGAMVDTGPDALTRAMIGGQAAESAPVVEDIGAADGPAVFQATGVGATDERGATRLRSATFAVHRGEIVGLVGVEGSGQRELLRVLAGRLAPSAGTIERPGEVGFVPEDRHEEAVLLERSLTENVALRGAGRRTGRMSWPGLRALTTRLMTAFDIRAPGETEPMRALSGGNQQKLVLARELGLPHDSAGSAEAVVLENPTRGLDVRATAEIHEQLRAARRRGAAVVVYSSDIDEVLLLASRVLVAHAGVVREVAHDRDVVGRAMLGAA
jgi:simple sugar transport system ATP-binding protein